jgi:tetratricopeptide (TPR) repeat protein
MNLSTQRYAPALAPRYARWLELHGQGLQAMQLLRSVRETLSDGFRVPPEQFAWFDLRIGDLALRSGRLDEAGEAFAAGLAEAPEDYRLLGAQARLHAVRHEWQPAIQAGERAVASVLDPATLGLLSDCYLALGDSAKASEYARAMEVSVSRQPGAFHRAWSLFLLDHNREVSQVRKKAMEELRTRRDVYGYDLAAWAWHKSGNDSQAEDLAAHALQLGTRDAMLYFHAGMIAYARGQDQLARERLSRALEINPYFHPTQVDDARRALREIGGQPSGVSLNR